MSQWGPAGMVERTDWGSRLCHRQNGLVPGQGRLLPEAEGVLRLVGPQAWGAVGGSRGEE